MSKTVEERAAHKRTTAFLIIVVAMLTVAVIVILTMEQCGDYAALQERRAATGVLPGLANEEVQSRLNEIVDEGMFNASINSVIRFENGEAMGDVMIENIAANHYDCTVDIYLKNTDEVILSTGLIKPGQYVEKMPLDRPLVDGVFDCTAVLRMSVSMCFPLYRTLPRK